MIELPEIPTKNIAVKLKPKGEKMVKKQHPWVFEDSIAKQNTNGNSGDVVIIYDNKKNKFLAIGLYDLESPIKIKLLHTGKPIKLDTTFFEQKIKSAYNQRKPLLKTKTNSYRLIYGEADGMPSFIADVYNNVLVIKLYSSMWFPYLKDIIPILIQVSNVKTVVLRLSRNVTKLKNKYRLSDGQVIFGALKDPVVVFKEHGITFSAHVIKGHKTGYFLDHRENRRRVGLLSKNKTVLDVFSYAGGFSVHALANGAKEVTSLDISAQALEVAKSNALLNKFIGKHHIIAGDAFVELENLKKSQRKFDVVIIDPPSFAKSTKEIEKAIKAYQKLAKLGIELVANKGVLVLASCSSRVASKEFYEICDKAMYQSNKKFKILASTQHDVDHPESLYFPEGSYLKTRYYQLL